MQKVSPKKYRLLILSISSPLLLGVYRDGDLIETIQSDKKTSEVLIELIVEVLNKYPLTDIFYTSGPGSYMAVKLTYIILKSIEVIKGIPFYGCSAFAFNEGRPIKAMGNLYFVKEKETIITKKYEESIIQKFTLPAQLDSVMTEETAIPNYLLSAV